MKLRPLRTRCGEYELSKGGLMVPRKELRAHPQFMNMGPAFNGSSGGGGAPSSAGWNPADKSAGVILSNNNYTANISGSNGAVRSLLVKTAGKWYWEVAVTGAGILMAGVANGAADLAVQLGTSNPNSWTYSGNGYVFHSGYLAYGQTFTAGSVIGIALDMDAGTLSFFKNGVSLGVAFTGIVGPVYAVVGQNGSTSTSSDTNFGQTDFLYSAPTGYTAFNGSLISGAHRYWRVYCATSYGPDATAIGDLYLRDETSTNRALIGLTGTPFASSINSVSYDAQWAFTADGVGGRFWQSAFGVNSAQWLGWDFGPSLAYNIRSFVIINSGNTAVDAKLITLQWSSDGTTWNDVSSYTNLTGQSVVNTFYVYDPYFNNVSALLHLDGVNGSTTITDVKGKAWVTTGAASISTASSRFGGASASFSGGYIYTPAHADFGFGAGDYTVEGFLNQTTQNIDRTLYDNRFGTNTGIGIYSSVNAPNLTNRLVLTNNAAIIAGDSSAIFSASTWQHWAVSRASGTIRGFIDGVLVWSVVDNRTYSASSDCVFGASATAAQVFSGNLDELRVTKGVARYTAAFLPPVSPFPNNGS
jgi:hypothetical protein